MSNLSYSAAELGAAGTDLDGLAYKTTAAGYTLVGGWAHRNDANGDLYYVSVTEVVDRAVFLAAIQAEPAMPTLDVTPTGVGQIAGDGVATGQLNVTDSRGAGAAGKVVLVEFPAAVVMADADQLTLNGSGYATLTIGPMAGCSGPLAFRFYYANGEAVDGQGSVQFVAP